MKDLPWDSLLPLNTITVSWAITGPIIATFFSHYLNKKSLREKPTAHISYDLGLHLVRRFVEFSSLHTIEELQAFTSQWVPVPHWVKSDEIEIPKTQTSAAAEHLQAQLGSEGIEQVGGKQWWQWRRDDAPLKAEWIEMRKDYHDRKSKGDQGRRVMLYVHGGAYYFGSVDEHRYQIMRHARKLKARCLAPKYRLAPQFPFPCGLHDCLSAYLYLLSEYEPTSIVVAGDSAGAGMVLSLLVILRDQGLPLPAGGILLSPWVDLMHSFPSLSGDGKMDYIPSHGFIHKPSMGWPPPTLEAVPHNAAPSGVAAAPQKYSKLETKSELDASSDSEETKASQDAEQGFSVAPADDLNSEKNGKPKRQPGTKYRNNMTGKIEDSSHIPSVVIDGNLVEIRDQIQIYAPNHLLTHPLVSPALQPSLGGLCPLLIQAGGGEMLRDEQIYIGHKAANPSLYPPSKEILDKYDPDRTQLNKYKPTDVQLQVWEDMAHVSQTFSWTRPAKYMYRSVAQFGAWALARAQNRPINIGYDSSDTESDGDDLSHLKEEGSGKSNMSLKNDVRHSDNNTLTLPTIVPISVSTGVGKAGDPLPPFINHMIRQRVDRHGKIHEMGPASSLPALQLSPDEIGVLKEGPVRKWLARQERWNRKFARTKMSLQKKRRSQLEHGYVGIPEGETPPATALAGRRTKDMPTLAKIKKSWGMSLWGDWGSKHDELWIQREQEEEELDEVAGQPHLTPVLTQKEKRTPTKRPRARSGTHSHRSIPGRRYSRRPSIRNVVDEGQAPVSNGMRPKSAPHTEREDVSTGHARHFSDPVAGDKVAVRDGNASNDNETLIPETQSGTTRPTHNGIAYPFSLKVPVDNDAAERNSSIMTLMSERETLEGVQVGDALDEKSNLDHEKTRQDGGSLQDEFAGSNGIATVNKSPVEEEKSTIERPHVERFVTAFEKL